MQEFINELVNNGTTILQNGGIIVGFLIIFIESIIPVLPLAIFIAFNLIAFGNITGFLVSYIATIIGCLTAYYIFYYLSNTKPIKKILQSKKLKLDILLKKKAK